MGTDSSRKPKYNINDTVLVDWRRKPYPAKIIAVSTLKNEITYDIHWDGMKKSDKNAIKKGVAECDIIELSDILPPKTTDTVNKTDTDSNSKISHITPPSLSRKKKRIESIFRGKYDKMW